VAQVAINGQPLLTYPVLIQIPQYIFAGFSETLVYSTGLELSYSEAPEQLKAILSSLYNVAQGLGQLLAFGTIYAFRMISDTTVSFGICVSLVVVFSALMFLGLRQYRYRREAQEPELYLSRAWQDHGLVFYGSGSEGSNSEDLELSRSDDDDS